MTVTNSSPSHTLAKDQKQMRNQSRIDALESDFYESPNKLAEDELSDEYDMSEEDDDDRRGRKRRSTASVFIIPFK
jgi:hypothetical protein